MTDNEIELEIERGLPELERQCRKLSAECERLIDMRLKMAMQLSDFVDRKNYAIISQKAEIERLKAELKELDKPNCSLEDVQQEEREQSKYFNLAVECARDKAIKEFARLIIDKSQDGVIRAADIPDLVKEMTEVQE